MLSVLGRGSRLGDGLSRRESIIASPALSNGLIFLRGQKHLVCIGEPK